MAGLASSFLGLRMDKDWRVRASDWEADDLSERQSLYAANDALVSINIAMQGENDMNDLLDRHRGSFLVLKF